MFTLLVYGLTILVYLVLGLIGLYVLVMGGSIIIGLFGLAFDPAEKAVRQARIDRER